MLLLQLTVALEIALLFVCVSGELSIKQINTDTIDSWPVRGVATYEFGGSSPKVFIFQCTTDSNNGLGLIFVRKDMVTIPYGQGVITNGVEVEVNPPTDSDAGVYICRDTSTNEEVQFLLTDADPASRAAADNLTHYVGDTVVIDMYASTLAPLTDEIISWKLNNTVITNGVFSNSKTTLTLDNVQLSDAGIYRIIVTRGGAGNVLSTSSNTTLHILEQPVVTDSIADQVTSEWEEVTLTCTADHASSVTWHRQEGNLSDTATIITVTIGGDSVTSSLIITDPRITDTGIYYCNATDDTRYAVSNDTQLTVLEGSRLVYTPTGGDSVILSADPLLFVGSSVDSFTVDCEGSGVLYWATPTGNVSRDPSSLPYQYNLQSSDDTFARLNYSSQLVTNELYTCKSSVQDTVYITNDNPVVYAATSEVIVGVVTDVVLRVYVGGVNPVPTSDDITWTHNGSPLPSSPHYVLQNNNTELVISNAPSNTTTGCYECTVTTAQGTSVTHINISYYDPPKVTVTPQTVTILEGDSVTFNCTAESELPVTLTWYYEQEDTPLMTIGVPDGILTLTNITSNDRGVYYCEAVDSEGVNRERESAILIVRYIPIVTVQTITTQPQSHVSASLEEMSSAPTYFCSVSAFPTATVTWRFMGGDLPEGVSQSNDGGFLKLSWSRSVLYSDNGTFSCHASNDIGDAVSNVHISVYALPTVTTVYSSDQSDVSITSPVLLTLPPFTDTVTITCLAHGLPIPSLYWLDSNGTRLNELYTSRSCGLVTATLELNPVTVATLGPVTCTVVNSIGSDSRGVAFEVDEGLNTTVTVPLPDLPSTDSVSVRISLNTPSCTSDLVSMLSDSLLSTVRLVIISASSLSCDTGVTIAVSSSGCGSNMEENVSSIFVITMTTSSLNQLEQAYVAVGEWIRSNPVVILNDVSYLMDQECDLLVQDSDLPLSCTPVPSSSLPTSTTPPNTLPTDQSSDNLTIVWISIVVVILLLLVIVVVALIIVLYLCIRSLGKKGSHDTSKTMQAWSEQQLSLATWRTASTDLSSQELSTSFRSNLLLQQSCSQDESSSAAGMMNNPEYIMRPEIEHIRQTMDMEHPFSEFNGGVASQPVEGYFGPPPSFPYNSPPTNQWSGVSHDSLRSATPINEKLYQPGLQLKEDPEYATIRSTAHINDQTDGQDGYINRIDPNTHRRATLPSNLRSSPNRRPLPIPHPRPHPQMNGRRPSVGNKWTTSSPSLVNPEPYSTPVASMGSLRNVGVGRPPPVRPHPSINKSTSSPDNQPGNRTGNIYLNSSQSPLPSVNEHDQWYQQNGDSVDIVTPSAKTNTAIEPYAVLFSPPLTQVPHPYSQPGEGGGDWQSSVSSTSPSTIRPHQVPSIATYQTIDV